MSSCSFTSGLNAGNSHMLGLSALRHDEVAGENQHNRRPPGCLWCLQSMVSYSAFLTKELSHSLTLSLPLSLFFLSCRLRLPKGWAGVTSLVGTSQDRDTEDTECRCYRHPPSRSVVPALHMINFSHTLACCEVGSFWKVVPNSEEYSLV